MVIKVECLKCKYSWETKSKMFYVSCPRCGSKVKIRNQLNTECDDGTRGSSEAY